MICDKVDNYFKKLANDAEKDTEAGCKDRAMDLARFIGGLYPKSDSLYFIFIKPKQEDRFFIFKRFNEKWRCHYALEWDGMIWDPSYGKPVISSAYYSTAFSKSECDLDIHKTKI